MVTTIKATELKGSRAVKKLREQKLKNGLPFMINTKELATDQCYIEYPNGIIKLVTLGHSKMDMDVLHELNAAEASQLRSRFQFSPVKINAFIVYSDGLKRGCKIFGRS